MVGRKLLPLFGPLGEGVITFGYDTLTEVSNAMTEMNWPGTETLDIVNLARTTVTMPLIHKEFEINKLDLAASRMSGQPINTSVVESAAYKVALAEDSLLINGWTRDGTNYLINGLYRAAGNSAATGDWGTQANIQVVLNDAISQLLADNIVPPYNLVVNPEQYAQLLVLITGSAVAEMDWVKSVLGGTVFVTPAITAGTGIVTAANPQGMFEYVLAEDLTTQTETVARSGNLFGKVYVRGLPVVYDANAICKLTVI
jgi:uncharacterized linocin/CFP29 family protein